MVNKRLHNEIVVFQESFQAQFIDFFLTSSLQTNKKEDEELLQEFAKKLYKNIFNLQESIQSKKEIEELREYGIKLGNELYLSLVFLLKHFIKYIKDNQKEIKLVELLTERIFEYINGLSKETSYSDENSTTHISFDASDNLYFGKNIIDHFKEIKEKEEEITFFNLYQGVPIKNKAKILDIEGEDVAFQTSRMQEIAMKLEGIAYILKDKNFDKHIRANIEYNNFLNNSVTLSNFTYMLNMPASQREFVRVHPNITAFVTLQDSENDHTRGKLYDLSTDGLGVVGEDRNDLYIGAKIQVSFSLYEREIQTKGELVNIIEYGSSYRFCVRIDPKEEEKKYIDEYVKLRENEILQELDKHLEDYGL